jgi:hypothetical protein
MKIFHCDHCQQLVFFENIRCLTCGHALAYLPDLADMGSLDAVGENEWRSPARAASERKYRLCENTRPSFPSSSLGTRIEISDGVP